MPDQEQLRILRSGVDPWNRWRGQNQESPLDLDGASLAGADLKGCDLSRATLFGADFRGTNLAEAHLESADLAEADLGHADLRQANLQNANMTRSQLRAANLTAADLRMTNLTGADLRQAILELTDLGGTIFADVDLSEAQRLELCRHWAPVVLDHRTLIKSPLLPVAFLRSCGLPEEMIENLPTLFSKPIQHYSVLIGASGQDLEFAKRLYTDLQSRGVRCWLWIADLETRQQSRWQPGPCISEHERRLILLLSRNSVGTEWVEKLTHASLQQQKLRQMRLLFPIQLDDAVLLAHGAGYSPLTDSMIDFRRPNDNRSYTAALNHLLKSMAAERLLDHTRQI